MKRLLLICLLVFLGCNNSSSGGGGSLPGIVSISPASGPVYGQTSLTIQGAGFMPGATAQVNSQAVLSLFFNSSSQLTVVIGPSLSGLGDVVVDLPGGTQFTLPNSYDYVPEVTIIDPLPDDFSEFGTAISCGDFSGDGIEDFIVGASSSDVGINTTAGEVFLYVANGFGGFSAGIPMTEQTVETGGRYGRRVALAQCLGDSLDDLVVSSGFADSGGQANAGEVFVYQAFGGSTFGSQIILSDPTPEVSGLFGRGLAVGDLTGDGLDDIAVGAPTSTGGGEVFIFISTGVGFNPMPVMSNVSADLNAEFGSSLAIGDVIGDANADLIVAAAKDDVGVFSNAGRVYVFTGDGTGNFTGPVLLSEPIPANNDNFGTAVTVIDIVGDPKEEIVVGDQGNVGATVSAGRAHVFQSNGAGGFLPPQTITQPTPEVGAAFGEHLAGGDVTGDGRGDLVIGAISAVTGNGMVFLVESDGITMQTPVETPTALTGANARYGSALAIGDVTGDGFSEILAGADGSTFGGPTDSGKVVVHATSR